MASGVWKQEWGNAAELAANPDRACNILGFRTFNDLQKWATERSLAEAEAEILRSEEILQMKAFLIEYIKMAQVYVKLVPGAVADVNRFAKLIGENLALMDQLSLYVRSRAVRTAVKIEDQPKADELQNLRKGKGEPSQVKEEGSGREAEGTEEKEEEEEEEEKEKGRAGGGKAESGKGRPGGKGGKGSGKKKVQWTTEVRGAKRSRPGGAQAAMRTLVELCECAKPLQSTVSVPWDKLSCFGVVREVTEPMKARYEQMMATAMEARLVIEFKGSSSD